VTANRQDFKVQSTTPPLHVKLLTQMQRVVTEHTSSARLCTTLTQRYGEDGRASLHRPCELRTGERKPLDVVQGETWSAAPREGQPYGPAQAGKVGLM